MKKQKKKMWLEAFLSNARLLLIGFNVFMFIFVIRALNRQDDDDSLSSSSSKSVLLVIAHPDDESMFFSPLLWDLKRRGRPCHVLCLSSGALSGEGSQSSTRRSELQRSCEALGCVKSVSFGSFQDGFEHHWDENEVAQSVQKVVDQRGDVGTLVTFDQWGVSHHPNHVACWKGCRKWFENQDKKKTIMLELQSVSLFRKYLGVLDAMLSVMMDPRDVFVLSSFLFSSCWTLWKHMATHYPTQMVWYRKAFVTFSRYTYLNTFNQI